MSESRRNCFGSLFCHTPWWGNKGHRKKGVTYSEMFPIYQRKVTISLPNLIYRMDLVERAKVEKKIEEGLAWQKNYRCLSITIFELKRWAVNDENGIKIVVLMFQIGNKWFHMGSYGQRGWAYFFKIQNWHVEDAQCMSRLIICSISILVS